MLPKRNPAITNPPVLRMRATNWDTSSESRSTVVNPMGIRMHAMIVLRHSPAKLNRSTCKMEAS